MAEVGVRVQQPKVVLLAFSHSATETGVVPAGRIFDDLIRRSTWYVTRQPKELIQGSQVLFYQAGEGMRGYATVANVSIASLSDQGSLRRFGLFHLTTKLELTEIVVFSKPVKLAPIVEKLDFISNKKYWGHALRATPRAISLSDFKTIVGCAADMD